MTDEQMHLPIAPLIKRLLAMIYDALVLLAISMVYGGLATLFLGLVFGTEEASDYRPMHDSIIFGLGWLASLIGFYWYFWYAAGQTVGMRAWRLKLISADGEKLRHRQCLSRVFSAPFSLIILGLGYLWSLFDRRGRCLHDVISRTDVVVLPKQEKKPKR